MIELLKYISESITNYFIFLFTSLFLYLLVVAIINVFFNKLMVTIVATIQVLKEQSDSKD